MGRHHYSDGEYVFIAGDPADGVYRLVSGSVRAESSGRAFASRGPIRPGDLFGEEGFLLGEARAYSVVAEGAVAADFLKRNEVLRLLSDRPGRLTPVLEELFAPVREAAPGVASDEAPVLQDDGGVPIRLVPDGKRIRTILGAEDLHIRRLPFSVGRTPDGEGMTTYDDVALALDDTRPFNLSRRHFSIDEDGGGLVVRDHNSYHGTMVNGLLLGGEGRPAIAPLLRGDNEIVAGKADSPFRFRVVVG